MLTLLNLWYQQTIPTKYDLQSATLYEAVNKLHDKVNEIITFSNSTDTDVKKIINDFKTEFDVFKLDFVTDFTDFKTHLDANYATFFATDPTGSALNFRNYLIALYPQFTNFLEDNYAGFIAISDLGAFAFKEFLAGNLNTFASEIGAWIQELEDRIVVLEARPVLEIVQALGQDTDKVPSSKLLDDSLDALNTSLGGDISTLSSDTTTAIGGMDTRIETIEGYPILDVTQELGESTTKVPSQDLMTTELAAKVDGDTVAGLISDYFDAAVILEFISETAVLPYADWTGASAPYSKAVEVIGVLPTDVPDIDLDLSTADYGDVATMQNEWSNIYRATTSADTVTFYTHVVPTMDLSFTLKAVR